jgi:hypothetical protein
VVARHRRLDPAWTVIAGSIVTVSVLKLAFVVTSATVCR